MDRRVSVASIVGEFLRELNSIEEIAIAVLFFAAGVVLGRAWGRRGAPVHPSRESLEERPTETTAPRRPLAAPDDVDSRMES